MTRAAFISAGGDPFILLLSYKLFKERWYDEVDKLYICYNTSINQELVPFVEQRLKDPKVEFIYVPQALSYGLPINKCLEKCSEDLIMLLEDDGYIYQRGVVGKHFKYIEGGEFDVIGSPRFSCALEVADAMKVKYNLDYSGEGDKGPNFWPNFFFCKRSDLLKTDLDFAPKMFPKGEYVKELDLTPETDLHNDTFVWTGIQMRFLGLRFKEVPQHKASPTELEDKQFGINNWKERPYGWLHAGSLSVFVTYLMLENYMPDPPNDFCLQELETRISFWQLAVELEEYSEIAEFKKHYLEGLEKTIKHYKMNENRINKKKLVYKQLLQI